MAPADLNLKTALDVIDARIAQLRHDVRAAADLGDVLNADLAHDDIAALERAQSILLEED